MTNPQHETTYFLVVDHAVHLPVLAVKLDVLEIDAASVVHAAEAVAVPLCPERDEELAEDELAAIGALDHALVHLARSRGGVVQVVRRVGRVQARVHLGCDARARDRIRCSDAWHVDRRRVGVGIVERE